MPTVHAFDYLESQEPAAPVTVLFGDEPFLQRLALHHLQQLLGDESSATWSGAKVEWRDVSDELATASLFGGGKPRLVVVDEADDFVSRYRDALETYVEQPRATGLLVLIVSSWASNTRLYKAVDRLGLQVQCKPPEVKGRGKSLDTKRLLDWLRKRAQSDHGAALTAEAAELLLDLVGPQFGLLDQELAKLALYADDQGRVGPDCVRDVVGGWKTRTTWEMVDAAASGDAATALAQLDHLLQSGEHPAALFGQIAWSLRRFATATQIYEDAERRGARIDVPAALEQAGFRKWPAGALQTASRQLKQITRPRARQLHRWLLEADLALKGSHSTPVRARFVLERLVLRLARQTSPR